MTDCSQSRTKFLCEVFFIRAKLGLKSCNGFNGMNKSIVPWNNIGQCLESNRGHGVRGGSLPTCQGFGKYPRMKTFCTRSS